jgi:hypothetical protein
MNLHEMFNNTQTKYESKEDDNTILKGLQDMRKSKLTLAQLNKIRVMNDMRTYEKEKELANIHKQYGTSAAPEF